MSKSSESKATSSTKAIAKGRKANKTDNAKRPIRWVYPSDYSIARGLDRMMLHEFQFLEEHRAFVAAHFDARIDELEKRFEKEMASIEDEMDRGEFADFMIDERYSLTEVMPKLQWQAQSWSSIQHSKGN